MYGRSPPIRQPAFASLNHSTPGGRGAVGHPLPTARTFAHSAVIRSGPGLVGRGRPSHPAVEKESHDGSCRTHGQRCSRPGGRRRRILVGVPMSETHQADQRCGGQPFRRRQQHGPAARRSGRGAAQGRQARGIGGQGQGGDEAARDIAVRARAWYRVVVPDDLDRALATVRRLAPRAGGTSRPTQQRHDGMNSQGYVAACRNVDAGAWRATVSRDAMTSADEFGARETSWRAVQRAAWETLNKSDMR